MVTQNMKSEVTLLQGDCREILKTLPDESVHCCVTSPPYWNLRDYNTGEWEGGNPQCPHATFPGAATGNKGNVTSVPERGVCSLCGAVRVDQQIGLEESLEVYVAELVGVFREVRRALLPSGTAWIILGDAFNAYNGNRGTTSKYAGDRERVGEPLWPSGHGLADTTVKSKDLIGLPWRVAFALRDDGWFLRSEIIWAKPNPMPESVTDRPTRAHETIFLLAKSARYYYDAAAIAEEATHAGRTIRYDGTQKNTGHENPTYPGHGGAQEIVVGATRNKRSVWTIPTQAFNGWTQTSRQVPVARDALADGTKRIASPDCPVHGSVDQPGSTHACDERGDADLSRRISCSGAHPASSLQPGCAGSDQHRDAGISSWSAPPGCTCSFYRDELVETSHFATFPPKLIEPCLLAGCPEGGMVLDPFAGSGTTGEVALRLGRSAVLIELSETYCDMIRDRLARLTVLPLTMTNMGKGSETCPKA
jgi:site-specific DNA-methyltransferase (adenine-specific)